MRASAAAAACSTGPARAGTARFAVCWGGVYWGTRAFLPLLAASDEGHLINTSSVNGFWAALGPDRPHTAYSSAKFAVKGFTEALITDLRVHAPHVGVSLVMPGHVGTGIVRSSIRHGDNPRGDRRREVDDGRSRRPLREERPDVGGRGGDRHPRRRAREQVAHPRRRRRSGPRSIRSQRTRRPPTTPEGSAT